MKSVSTARPQQIANSTTINGIRQQLNSVAALTHLRRLPALVTMPKDTESCATLKQSLTKVALLVDELLSSTCAEQKTSEEKSSITIFGIFRVKIDKNSYHRLAQNAETKSNICAQTAGEALVQSRRRHERHGRAYTTLAFVTQLKSICLFVCMYICVYEFMSVSRQLPVEFVNFSMATDSARKSK